jgi:hypothetical protein
MDSKGLRALGTAYAAVGLALALAALAARVLGEKMLDSMVQLMGAVLLP